MSSRVLILMRHGKSGYPEGVADHERPLAERGQREAGLAGDWLRANPAEGAALMRENPSYIFLRRLPDTLDGPIGALGVPLLAQANAAADPATLVDVVPVELTTPYDAREVIARLVDGSRCLGGLLGRRRLGLRVRRASTGCGGSDGGLRLGLSLLLRRAPPRGTLMGAGCATLNCTMKL